MTLILTLTLAALCWWLARYVRKSIWQNNTRERLMFDFEQPLYEVEEINLSAGDYGLIGYAKFLYFLNQAMSSPSGYLSIFAFGAIAAILFKLITGTQLFPTYIVGLMGGTILLAAALLYLGHQRKKRLQKIKYELPNALQSIMAVMEGGMAFESALKYIVQESNKNHPLYFDLSVVLEAMQRGRRRNEALRLWAVRAKQASVSEVVNGIVQAEQTGASLGSVLKHHAQSILKENEAELLRRAERIPIYMLFPMLLCIMPPIFIIAVGPSALRIFNMFKIIMENA